MSVLVFADATNGKFKKSAFEVVSYGKKVAEQLNTNLVAVTVNVSVNEELFYYGAEKVISVSESKLTSFNAKAYSSIINKFAESENATVIVLDSSIDTLHIAPLVAVSLDAGYVSNVIALPSSISPFTIKRKVFSNKGYANTVISTEKKIIGVAKNSFGIHENPVSGTVKEMSVSLPDSDFGVKSEKVEKASGKVTIADADVVVSAGRGMKGPENWGMIEELAAVLGAATACSKPVSDLGWRPHGEHVGQTGKPVASNLYIAIGISGAIQQIGRAHV